MKRPTMKLTIIIDSFIVGLFMAYEMKHALEVDDSYGKAIDEDEDDFF